MSDLTDFRLWLVMLSQGRSCCAGHIIREGELFVVHHLDGCSFYFDACSVVVPFEVVPVYVGQL